MSATPSDLADLRRQLDEIDDRMHDLLIERAEIVAQVAARKAGGAGAFYQPAREAQILRRLVARHHGGLPAAAVVRIWREMLAATVRLETPFAVAVFAPAEAQGYWDLARDHYGSHAPLTAYRSPGQVIRAVSEGRAAVGILPLPQEGDTDPWGRYPAAENGRPPRGGADRSLFLTERSAGISRTRLLGVLSEVGLSCTFFAACEQAEGVLNLIEVDGFVVGADPRVAQFRARLGTALHRVLPFGGYALPLAAAALSPDTAKG